MKFEIGREQFVAIGRAADALANRLSGGFPARVRVCAQSENLMRFQAQGELADASVWLPVNVYSDYHDTPVEVDFAHSYANVAGEGPLMLDFMLGNVCVEVMNMGSVGEPLDVLGVFDDKKLVSQMDEISDAELRARIPLSFLCGMLRRVLWVAEDAIKDKFKCVWLRFRCDELSMLSTNGQLAVCVHSQAECMGGMNDICLDLSYMRAVYFFANLWTKRSIAAEEVYCNIYWSEREGQFLFNLSGNCIEAIVLVTELSNDFVPEFMGSWEKYQYREGLMFYTDAEELDPKLASTEVDLAMAQEEVVELRVKNRKMRFFVSGGDEETVPSLIIRDPTWCALPKKTLTCHICPGLLRKVLKKEEELLLIEFPINLGDAPVPYYVTLKNNKNVRYTLMPATKGCHE